MAGQGAVLITGCSTGIGAETARHLATRGHRVYATARRPETLEPLRRAGCETLELDVTDEASMTAAVAAVEAAEGAVGTLVNNAGYSQMGAIEEIPMADMRRQFETNVFGLMRMCQLVLPGMRRARRGTIVNVSSIGGKLTVPGIGAYHASKYAVEALSDALRFEVAGFGVRVVVIEPGLIKTHLVETANAIADQLPGAGPYSRFHAAVAKSAAEIYDGPLGRLGGGPDTVARAIERAITARRPRPRYPVTPSAGLALAQRRLLSDRMWDRLAGTQFPRPGR